jgi:hypothetical protein
MLPSHRPRRAGYTYALSLALLVPLVLSACGTSAQTPAPPRAALGDSEGTLNRLWSVHPTATACIRENLALTCYYQIHRIRLTVTYDQRLTAVQITANSMPHPVANMWTFLTGLVPAAMTKTRCRNVSDSIGGGTARACLYHSGTDVIVAYFPHPTDPKFGGIVAYDYSGFRLLYRYR